MSDLSLQPRSGTNVAVLNGIIHLLMENNWIDSGYIRNHTIGFEELKQTVSRYDPNFVEQITTIPKAKLIQCAEWIGYSKKKLW